MLLNLFLVYQFLGSEMFSQDPLEEHFGRQRRRGDQTTTLISRIWTAGNEIECNG